MHWEKNIGIGCACFICCGGIIILRKKNVSTLKDTATVLKINGVLHLIWIYILVTGLRTSCIARGTFVVDKDCSSSICLIWSWLWNFHRKAELQCFTLI